MKIPVIKAVAATFAYLARHWLTLAKAMWLPTLIVVGVQLYFMPQIFNAMDDILALGETATPQEFAHVMEPLVGPLLAIVGCSIIFYPMIIVASLVHLVRGDQLSMPFYVKFGGDELRVLGAYVLFSMMLTICSVVGDLGVAGIGLVGLMIAPQIGELLRKLAELVVNIAIMWFRLRLSVLFPAVIATRTLGFGAAWSATKGNALRLFFFWMIVGIIMMLLALALMAPILPTVFPVLSAVVTSDGNSAAELEAVRSLIATLGEIFNMTNPSFLIVAVTSYLTTLLLTAISSIASGVAWRYLSGDEHETA